MKNTIEYRKARRLLRRAIVSVGNAYEALIEYEDRHCEIYDNSLTYKADAMMGELNSLIDELERAAEEVE